MNEWLFKILVNLKRALGVIRWSCYLFVYDVISEQSDAQFYILFKLDVDVSLKSLIGLYWRFSLQ